MDFDTITGLATAAGVGSGTLAKVALISIAANAVGRLIPDDKRGVLGVLRKVAKTVGLYVPNRITSAASTTSVARDLLERQIYTRGERGRFEPMMMGRE